MTKLQQLSCVIMCLIMLSLSAVLIAHSLPNRECQAKLSHLEQENSNKVANLPSSSTIEVYQVSNKTVFTAYTLSIEETDGSPCIGAGNHNLCELRPILKEKGISICASRDLPLHTYIYIAGFGMCEILDRLNVRYSGSNRVDILFDSREEALNFGIKKLKYIIIN